MNDWYVKLDNEIVGPLSPSQMKKLVREGRISADTPVRRGPNKKFVSARRIKGLFDSRGANQPTDSRTPVVPPKSVPGTRRRTVIAASACLFVAVSVLAGGATWFHGPREVSDDDKPVTSSQSRPSEWPVAPAIPGGEDPAIWKGRRAVQQSGHSESSPLLARVDERPTLAPTLPRADIGRNAMKQRLLASTDAPTTPAGKTVPMPAANTPPIASSEAIRLVEGPLKKFLSSARTKSAPATDSGADPETEDSSGKPTPAAAAGRIASERTDSMPAGFSDKDRTRWAPVIEQASKFTSFQPFLINGVPVLGDGGGNMMTREQRFANIRAAEQIDTLLTWMATPDASDNVERALADGATNAKRNLALMDFALFEDCIEQFGGREEYNRFSEMWKSELNQFDKAKQVQKIFGQYNQHMKTLALKEVVPLSFLAQAILGDYDAERQTFELPHVSLPQHIVRMSRLDFVYVPNDVKHPRHIPMPPDEAETFARTAEGRELALKTDVRLRRFRSAANRYVNYTNSTQPTVNVEVVGYSILAVDDPASPLWSWSPRPSGLVPAGTDVVPAEHARGDALNARMLRIAKEHNLTILRGYPAIHNDLLDYDKQYDRRFRALLDRVNLGLNPDTLDAGFVALHFPRAIGEFVTARVDRRHKLIEGGQWLGRDQFAQRASQAAFLEKFKKEIDEYAVELPIRFTEVFTAHPAMWGTYDFERKGVLVEFNPNRRPLSPLSSSTYSELPLHRRPFSFDSFVPMDAETAKVHFFQRNEDGDSNLPVMARTVTLYKLDLEDARENSPPKIAVSYDSLALYKTLQLKEKLADLNLRELPPPILSQSETPILASPGQPLDLDPYTLLALQIEATGKQPSPDVLKKQFERFRYDESETRGDRQNAIPILNEAEKTLYQHGTNRPLQGTREEAEKALEKARADRDRLFADAVSPFFPYGDSKNEMPTPMQSRLASKWLDWLRMRLASSNRHVVLQGRIEVDPDVGDVEMVLAENRPRHPSDWDVTVKLIADGTPAENMLPISRLYDASDQRMSMSLPRTPAGRTIQPCLVMTRPLTELADSVPDTVRKKIVAQRHNNTVRFELIVRLTESSFRRGERDDGLILQSVPIGARIYSNDSPYDRQVMFEGHFETADNDHISMHSSLPPRDAESKPVARSSSGNDSQTVQPLTPAAMTWILAKFVPEAMTDLAPQMMLSRWEHEQDFRRKRDRSSIGVQPDRGMYFRKNAVKPSPPQLLADAAGFADWMRERSGQVGNRFTMTLSTRFGELDASVMGHRRSDGRRTRIDIENVRNELARKVETEKYMREFDRSLQESRKQRGGGGGLALNPGAKNQPAARNSGSNPVETQPTKKLGILQKELRNLEVYAHNYAIASPFIDLSGEDGRFVVRDLQGRHRVQAHNSQLLSGQWRPDQQAAAASEPVHPWLRLDQDLVLPQDLGIEPGNQEFKVAVTFDINSGRLVHSRPLPVDPATAGPFAASLVPKDANEALIMGDFGKYAVLYASVVEATLLDPRTGKPLHQLHSVEPVQPQHLP